MAKYEELQGKIAIITGAGRGIGRAIALRLAHEGAAICVTDVDLASAQVVAQQIIKDHGQAITVKVDVTKQDDIDKMISATVNEFGTVDILVNNAGVGAVGKLIDTDEPTWDWVMAVNAKGTFLCCKAAAKQMIKQ